MLLVCIVVWCASFIFLTFNLKDLSLIGLLIIAVAAYFIGYAATSPAADAIILLAGMTLGKGAGVLLRLKAKGEMLNEEGKMQKSIPEFSIFLIGLVVLLAFASWWHLDMTNNYYHGPRWMGLWDNPNDYGLLMAVGVVLAIGLLAQNLKSEKVKVEIENREAEPAFTLFRRGKSGKQKLLVAFLLIAAGMMGVGLLFSYSRGAWVGAAIGLLYLAKAYGKFKWRYVVLGAGLVALGALLIWGRTPDSAPWFVKRMDLSRASAQHRVAAWKAGFEIMRDHPFGVGWNKAVAVYEKNYSPPENGAAAITTNDYLMLGTQLGLPGLVCFVAYVALCFKRNRPHLTLTLSPPAGSGDGIAGMSPVTCHPSLQTACRAGALAMLVAFWFDGGLFKLATAAVFWILLELSQIRSAECGVRSEVPQSEIRNPKSAIGESLVTPAATK